MNPIDLWWCTIQNGRLIRGQKVKFSYFCLLTLERSSRLTSNFHEWWISVSRSALLICDDARFKMADLSEIKRSNLAILLITLERSGRLTSNFQEWWIWVSRSALLICDDAGSNMVDLSEVKRSNFAILLNNSRMLWPIDVKLSGVMDIGKKMITIDLWW